MSNKTSVKKYVVAASAVFLLLFTSCGVKTDPEPSVSAEALEEDTAAATEANAEEPSASAEALEEDTAAATEANEEEPSVSTEALEEEPSASAEAPAEEPPVSVEEKYDGTITSIGFLRVCLPDDSWSAKMSFGAVGLYKQGHHKGDDPTIRVFLDENSLQDSMDSADAIIPTIPHTDFELAIGPYNCVGHRAEIKIKTTSVIDRIFFPVSDDLTLRFQLFVQNGSIEGVDKDDPEVQNIIQSVIELNGYDKGEMDISEMGDENGIVDSGEDSGTTWTLYNDGVLHIGGSPRMVFHQNSDEYQWAKYRRDVTEIRFDVDVTVIPNLAFKKFKNLKNVEIPSSVKEMYIGCFEECTALEQVVLPDSLQELDYYVFAGCSSLREITVPGTLRHIGNYAFESCLSLENARIENGVESFGYDIFSNCPSLQTVYLPDTLRKIGQYSFHNTGLKDVYYEGSESDFAMIEIEAHNEDLQNAEIHFG